MLIEFSDVDFVYEPDSPWETVALRDINLRIEQGEFVGLIGGTGSGKSTLIQHMNGLLQPTAGTVRVDGRDLAGSKEYRRELRREVGLIFQYPEHQLFEETVEEDVGFGPANLGLSDTEVERRVGDALRTVGLAPGEFAHRSPFNLSGGQMRRVAIAGVLAMEPKVLVLDEPTAGLDPRGSTRIMRTVKHLHDEGGRTVVLVSHNMIDISFLAERVIVMEEGRIVLDGPVETIFGQYAERLRELGLDVPPVTAVLQGLRAHGAAVPGNLLTVPEAAGSIADWMRSQKHV